MVLKSIQEGIYTDSFHYFYLEFVDAQLLSGSQ